MALQKAGKTIDEVTKRMDTGHVAAAVDLLQQTITSLKKYGAAAQVVEAVRQLENLLAQVETGELSLRERKLSKYRSHSYGKMSSHELWSAKNRRPVSNSRRDTSAAIDPNASAPGADKGK